MITILPLQTLYPIQSSWTDKDIYPENAYNVPDYSLKGEKDQNAQYAVSGSTIYIYDCFFHDISSHFHPAIYYLSGGKMLVELSTFMNCTSRTSAGCIYQSDGHFVMNKCCSIRCYIAQKSNAWGQFASTYLSSGNKNNVLDSSISLSYNVDSDSPSFEATLWLQGGNIIAKTVNLSKNKCQWNTAIVSQPSLSGTCSISFSSFNGNEATDVFDSIIYFAASSVTNIMTSCNVINNIQKSTTTNGMICTNDQLTIKSCCIINNATPILFEGYQSSDYNGVIRILNCTIKEEDIKKISGSVITNCESWKPISSFINAIKCTKDGEFCQASYDAVGMLSPNVNVDPPNSSDNSGKCEST